MLKQARLLTELGVSPNSIVVASERTQWSAALDSVYANKAQKSRDFDALTKSQPPFSTLSSADLA